MSIESWKKEFYPVPAGDCPEQETLNHSLLKWKGARKANLRRHKCWIDYKRILDKEDGEELFSSDGCALCTYYLSKKTICEGCPLSELLGLRCDLPDEYYKHFLRTQDPEPMIMLITSAIRIEEKEQSLSTMKRRGIKDASGHHCTDGRGRLEGQREMGGRMMSEIIKDYDMGLLNDYGGGDVAWWYDYIRAEIGRCNDYWREQVSENHDWLCGCGHWNGCNLYVCAMCGRRPNDIAKVKPPRFKEEPK